MLNTCSIVYILIFIIEPSGGVRVKTVLNMNNSQSGGVRVKAILNINNSIQIVDMVIEDFRFSNSVSFHFIFPHILQQKNDDTFMKE